MREKTHPAPELSHPQGSKIWADSASRIRAIRLPAQSASAYSQIENKANELATIECENGTPSAWLGALAKLTID
jgi:hypothetical protein